MTGVRENMAVLGATTNPEGDKVRVHPAFVFSKEQIDSL